jgi:hypothetical protein
MSENKITLSTLLNFRPKNEVESEIFNNTNISLLNKYLNDMKSTWSRASFYLGGQIRLGLDDEITIELINKVRKINNEKSHDIYNSMELYSMNNSYRELTEMENIILMVNKIYKLRIVNELEKLHPLANVNDVVISFI